MKKGKTSSVAWEEEERPKSFDDYIDEGGNLEYILPALENKQLRNIILWGNAGHGKTCLGTLILKRWLEIQTDNSSAKNVEGLMLPRMIELNASDERGIDTVRTKIKGRSQTTAFLLDEADALTLDAQHALRRIMEKGKANTVHPKMFILCVNYPHKIIDPIKSRCDIYFVPDVSYENTKKKCMVVLKKRKIKTINWPAGVSTKPEREQMFEIFWQYIFRKGQTEGGLRKSISEMQKFCDEEKGNLNIPPNIAQMIPDVNDVFVLLDSVIKPINADEEANYGQIYNSIRNLLYNPDPKKRKQPIDILRAANDWLLEFSETVPNYVSLQMSKVIGKIDYRLKIGSDPMAQFPSMFSSLRLVRLLGTIKQKQDQTLNELRQDVVKLKSGEINTEEEFPEFTEEKTDFDEKKEEFTEEMPWDEMLKDGYFADNWNIMYNYMSESPRSVEEVMKYMQTHGTLQTSDSGSEVQEYISDGLKNQKVQIYVGKLQEEEDDDPETQEQNPEEKIEDMVGYNEETKV